MERILELALKAAEEAEVYEVSSEETQVHFEANRLKQLQTNQSTSVALRIIKDGKLGYATASGAFDQPGARQKRGGDGGFRRGSEVQLAG